MAAVATAALVVASPAWAAVSLTSPANGSRSNDSTPTFSGVADFSGASDPNVTVKVWNGPVVGSNVAGDHPVSTGARSMTDGVYSVDLSPPALADGTYTARAEQSTDVSSPVTFTVDTVAPLVTLVSPADGSSTTDTTPGVNGAAGDALGDKTDITVTLYAGPNTSGSVLQSPSVPRNGASWSGGLGTLALGTYTVQASQSDNAGNVGLSATHTFTVASPSTSASVSPSPPPSPPPFTPAAGGAAKPGPVAPALLTPFPIVRIVGVVAGKGTKLSLMAIRAPARSTIDVRCTGRSCPFKRRISRVGSRGKTVTVTPLVGPTLRAGVVLEVRVSQTNRVGKYTRFRIRDGKSPLRLDSCVMPGKPNPVRCPG